METTTRKTLVCIIGSLRTPKHAFESFKKHVLDPFNADLLLCCPSSQSASSQKSCGDDQEAWIKSATHTYFYTEPSHSDLEKYLDKQSLLFGVDDDPPQRWKSLLNISDNWLGGLPGRPGSGLFVTINRNQLRNALIELDLHDNNKYDRFIITRSDFFWISPHPDILPSPGEIWIPDTQHWGGMNDRHVVLSKHDILKFLDQLRFILDPPQKSEPLFLDGKIVEYLNTERWQKFFSIAIKKLTIKTFPTVSFLIMDFGMHSCSGVQEGILDDSLGVSCKNIDEKERSIFNVQMNFTCTDDSRYQEESTRRFDFPHERLSHC